MNVRFLLLLAQLTFYSQANAQNWALTPTTPQGTTSDIQYWDNQLLVSTYGGFIFKSTNEGQSWQTLALPGNPRPIFGLHRSSNHWFASCAGGFYTSNNGGTHWRWVSIPSPYVPSAFAVLGNDHWVVATADLATGTAQASGIMRSTNQGSSWESVTANLPGTAIAKMLQSANDQLVVALDQAATTASLFTTWLGPSGSFHWVELPTFLHYQTDSSRAAFQASTWFDMHWQNDSTLLLSADGVVREAGATNGVYVQWMGYRKVNTGSTAEFWVETLPFRPQFNSWWDQAAPANILQHSETGEWYGSLRGGNARGGAWMRPSVAQGWHKANNGIPAGPEGWDLLRFAEGPYGRVFAIHQGFSGVYFTDFSRRWAASTPALQAEKLHLWPNPGDGKVQLSFPAGRVYFEITNGTGQTVWEQEREDVTEGGLDVSFLPAGIYFVKAYQEGKVFQGKYIKAN